MTLACVGEFLLLSKKHTGQHWRLRSIALVSWLFLENPPLRALSVCCFNLSRGRYRCLLLSLLSASWTGLQLSELHQGIILLSDKLLAMNHCVTTLPVTLKQFTLSIYCYFTKRLFSRSTILFSKSELLSVTSICGQKRAHTTEVLKNTSMWKTRKYTGN